VLNTEKTDVIRDFKKLQIDAEVIVIGAGIAGISAALSAARQNKKTILVTDRPILGGSASSEIRVGPCGAAAPPFNKFARETGIIEEIFNHLHYMASNARKWRWFYFDQIYFDIVLKQENLSIYLNTSIYEVNKDTDDVILSVKGLQLRAETIYDFSGKIFIDCTGDGTVGFLSGAHYRVGREGKSEYNEVYSPENPDTKTMGATLLFTTVDAGHSVKFKTPDWAVDIEELPSFERINRSIHKMPDGSYYGFWWVEYGGEIDSIHDDGEIMLHLRKVVNGLWGHIKNSGDYSDAENQEINWIGYLPGKRESRRLVGPYIVNAHDLTGQRKFLDSIGYTGWPIDIHPPKGYLAKEPGCTHDYLLGITDIPFRCIYSKNIQNLLFAGRHISCTHEALGTLRVISTTSVMGQAAGIAAAMCLNRNIWPSDISKKYIDEFQKKLLRCDQSIIGKKLVEESDFSRNAIVSVSSEKACEIMIPETYKYLDKAYGIILPIESKLDSVSLFMESNEEKEVTVDIYLSDEIQQNYRIGHIYKSLKTTVSKKNWYNLKIDINECPGNKIFVMIRKTPGVKLFMGKDKMTAVLGIEADTDIFDKDTIYKSINDTQFIQLTPCFMTEPEQRLYRPKMINNGFIRPLALPNSWMSEKLQNDKFEWIKLSFDVEKKISKAEIVFNSDLNPRRIVSDINSVNPEMVKSYELTAITSEGEVIIAEQSENYMRFVCHTYSEVKAKGVILKIHETWGSPYAEVFDLRIY